MVISLRQYGEQALVCFSAALMFAGIAACSDVTQNEVAAPGTAMEQASAVRCDRGLTRIELVGGVEDGFVSNNSEPSRIRPARLPNEYLEAVAGAQSGAMQLRDYDEIGQDRMLIDHFDAPRDIVSGAVIVRLRTTGGSANDSVKLGNLNEREFADGFGNTEAFVHNFKDDAENPEAAQSGAVVVVPLETLVGNVTAKFKGNFK